MTSTRSAEIVVVGGGAMGSAAAWQLARGGHDVVLLERFSEGHANGASHGASRNFNVSYDTQPYLDYLVEALPLWRELEADVDAQLLDLVGLVTHGGGSALAGVRDALHSVGIAAELLPAAEASGRWSGIRFESEVLFTPQAGRLNADTAVAALQRAATAHGADIRHNTAVERIDVLDDDCVRLTIDGRSGARETIEARRVIVTVGAWTTKLLDGILPLPRLVVTQEQPAHFAVTDPDARWPGFNHRPGNGDEWWPSAIYGMLTPGEGVKAGWHGVGPVTDPDARTFRSEPEQLALLQRYAREWLPGVDPETFTEISCTYTTTPDSDFILDRAGPVIVGAGFSGHGFKFTPVVGRVLADLALDRGPAHPAFSLARFR
ncbi:FAD-dependent oxidoreductase [Leifsonia sp. NPDC058292]|uniref:FAD-dependent oxidoreductase n=1 Tax=Leifsonia sp. NPDC058292 TaxID=3346428 RepID=UPI0036DC01EF